MVAICSGAIRRRLSSGNAEKASLASSTLMPIFMMSAGSIALSPCNQICLVDDDQNDCRARYGKWKLFVRLSPKSVNCFPACQFFYQLTGRDVFQYRSVPVELWV